MNSYFVDPQGHELRPNNARYIVKMFCRSCQKIYDKRECRKHIRNGNQIIIKHRGQIEKTLQVAT